MAPTCNASASELLAGAATVDITPSGSVFLYGYPHVPRYSTGVHDPLECTALYLRSGDGVAIFLATDLINFSKSLVADVRKRICERTGVAEEAILMSATHTHSGPVMVGMVSNGADPIVPKPDPNYLRFLTEKAVEAAVAAHRAAVPAEIGLAVARAEGVGTNRHDPAGPADAEVPVLIARNKATRVPLACMVVYAMHPTVLHEDSTLLSGDFPGLCRQWLRAKALPSDCPILYHNGASGNQSPRHVTRGNTFAEAARLGELLGRAIAGALEKITFSTTARVHARRALLELTPRAFPDVAEAHERVERVRARFEQLKREGVPRPAVRTAECDVFGAEETAELAAATSDGRLAAAIARCMPAEIQAIDVGEWRFVGWPGEFFVEYALAVKASAPGTFVITLANGELQGYVVTPEAAARGVYESTNAVFAPENGAKVVEATLALVRQST